MSCRSCQSNHRKVFYSEINIHIPGLHSLSEKSVWAFPQLLVCLDCGFTELHIEQTELSQLGDGIDEQESAA